MAGNYSISSKDALAKTLHVVKYTSKCVCFCHLNLNNHPPRIIGWWWRRKRNKASWHYIRISKCSALKGSSTDYHIHDRIVSFEHPPLVFNDRNQCSTTTIVPADCLPACRSSPEILICNKNLNNLSQIDSITPPVPAKDSRTSCATFYQRTMSSARGRGRDNLCPGGRDRSEYLLFGKEIVCGGRRGKGIRVNTCCYVAYNHIYCTCY